MLPLIPRLFPRRRLLVGLGMFLALVVGLPGLAGATSVSATGTPYLGADLSVTLTIDDGIDPGNLVITLTIDPGVNTGDLRSFYAQISDESLIPGLSVSGIEVTGSQFAANAVKNVGMAAGIATKNSPCKCDFGVAFGGATLAADDLKTVTFVLSHVSEALTVDLFANQGFAARANFVTPPNDPNRRLSNPVSKLSGLVVIPEPTTAVLMLLGLAGLAAAGTRKPSA